MTLSRTGFFSRQVPLLNDRWLLGWYTEGLTDPGVGLALLEELGVINIQMVHSDKIRAFNLIFTGVHKPYYTGLVTKSLSIDFILNLSDEQLTILEDECICDLISSGHLTAYGAVCLSAEDLDFILKEGFEILETLSTEMMRGVTLADWVNQGCQKDTADQDEYCMTQERYGELHGPITANYVTNNDASVEQINAENPEIEDGYREISVRRNGEVYSGMRRGLPVAIKRIRICQPPSVDKLPFIGFEQCMNEVQIFKFLTENNAPHMIRLLGYYFYDCYCLLVMEYAALGDLKQYINNNPAVDVSIRLRMLCQLAEAIVFMHDNQYIHCDIKPSNIFLSGDCQVKLGDVGLSLSAGDARSYRARGTKWYKAPELFYGNDQFNSFASDCYAYAITASEVMSWELAEIAFSANTKYDMTHFSRAVQYGARPVLSEKIPVAIKGMIENSWCLSMQYRLKMPAILSLLRAQASFFSPKTKEAAESGVHSSLSQSLSKSSVVAPNL